MRLRSLSKARGTTLPEVLVSALLVAVFFASMYEVNAVCLHYVSGSKENVSSIECVHDRIEQLRNLDFATLTNATAVASTMSLPPNSSVLAQQGTETVTISSFSDASGTATTPRVTFVRGPGAVLGVSPNPNVPVSPTTTWNGGASFGTATAVQIDVSLTWNTTFGGRARTEQTSTIVVAGTKK